MPLNVPARETPVSAKPQIANKNDDQEPQLAVDQIQGNILAGFNKDNQTLIFVRIDNPEEFREWLYALIPFIATTDEVLQFNRLFKKIRARRSVESRAVLATWLNLAFTCQGLKKLTSDADTIEDAAFKAGLAKRSESLSDPLQGEGFQKNWLTGGEGKEADLILIVASDSAEEMGFAVANLESWIYVGAEVKEHVIPSGASIIYQQRGATLPDPLRGHEHFGFLDGVSQPGVRGSSSLTGELITPKQNPGDPGQGKPGQDRLWPGEFVFGYPAQDPLDTGKKGEVRRGGPAWMENGSFLVFRRLRQDVKAFHEFLEKEGGRLNLGSGLFGAKCVGRWESGAPIERAARADNPVMSRDDCANNAFDFQKDTKPQAPKAPGDCKDNFPADLAQADKQGLVCPFAGHIRKAYPRDDESADPKNHPFPNEANTETHRFLRRGIPFGEPFDSTIQPDDGNRGLLFLAYQTSIENQFEFVIKNWVNNPDFKDPGSGHDPILGQSNKDGSRERSFSIKLDGKGSETVTMKNDFVIPTGGGYFFAPSIAALEKLSGHR